MHYAQIYAIACKTNQRLGMLLINSSYKKRIRPTLESDGKRFDGDGLGNCRAGGLKMNLTFKYNLLELEKQATEIAVHIEKLIKAYANEEDNVELPMLQINDVEKFIKDEVEIDKDEYYEDELYVRRRYYSNGKIVEYLLYPITEDIITRNFYMELELSQLDKVKLISNLSRVLVNIQDNITNFDFYNQIRVYDDKAVMKIADKEI